MQRIVPFLWFDGKAEEEESFYTSVFKNSKIEKITHYGDAGPDPKGTKRKYLIVLNNTVIRDLRM